MRTFRYLLLATNTIFLALVLFEIMTWVSRTGSLPRPYWFAISVAAFLALNLIYLWRTRPAVKDGRRLIHFLAKPTPPLFDPHLNASCRMGSAKRNPKNHFSSAAPPTTVHPADCPNRCL